MARKTVHTPIKGADGKETLEERRLRQLVEKDADARVKRLEGIKLAEAKKVHASTQVKMPVTLTSVYETFLKRIKACPVKVMRSEEKDQFGRAPRVTKIEARFLDMPQGNVMQSLKGLDIRALAKPTFCCWPPES